MSVLFNCFICSSIDVNNGNNMERNGTVLRANDISEQFGQYCDKLCVIGPSSRGFHTVVFVLLIESSMCERQCCGPTRGFIMHIVNNYSQVVYINNDNNNDNNQTGSTYIACLLLIAYSLPRKTELTRQLCEI